MIPNMFKIAGELTPAVIHVAARTVATHALSIFGDHSDVMHARTTGWAMLSAGSVQEAHDFALVAHAATLRARVPFLHFFDGFRTSHEVNKIEVLDADDLRALDPRGRPARLPRPRPHVRGAGRARAPPRTRTCSSRPARRATRIHAAVPGIVQEVFDELAARTGRRYSLVEYHGAPDADRVIVIMGSGAGRGRGDGRHDGRRAARRSGVVTVRLFQPFPADAAARRAAADASARSRSSTARRSRAPSASRCTSTCVAALAEAMDSRRAAVRGRPARHRRPLRAVLEGVHAGDGQAGLRRAGAPRARSATSPSASSTT